MTFCIICIYYNDLQLFSLTIGPNDESSSGFETSTTMTLTVDNPEEVSQTPHHINLKNVKNIFRIL
jgi:hypothetical protein